MTRDTVETETPAALATSTIVALEDNRLPKLPPL
jgi:hypothetical protein